jgi:hypothetical protein
VRRDPRRLSLGLGQSRARRVGTGIVTAPCRVRRCPPALLVRPHRSHRGGNPRPSGVRGRRASREG